MLMNNRTISDCISMRIYIDIYIYRWLLVPYPQNNRAPALTQSIAVHNIGKVNYYAAGLLYEHGAVY